MKNFLSVLAIVLTAFGASYWAFYAFVGEDSTLRQAARERNTMAWLRYEFHLSGPQYGSIRELQNEYLQECAGQVAAIAAARLRRDSPGELAGLEADSVRSMKDHFRKVSLMMSPEDGQHYLEIVQPFIDDQATHR